MPVKEALGLIRSTLGARAAEINMMNNKFIEMIVSDHPEEFRVMVPESRLDDLIERTPELHKLSRRTLFHKKFYENIDDSFPFQNLTLEQIGIPRFDVIRDIRLMTSNEL